MQSKFVILGYVIAVVVLLMIPTNSAQETGRLHGENCSATEHCLINAGLICTDEKCACSDGPLNNNYAYDLEWVQLSRSCEAKLGSACIGTSENVLPSGQIRCIGVNTGGAHCVQIEGMPLGVGFCAAPPRPMQLHGQECDQNRYCDPAVGLICSNTDTDVKRCSCASGRISHLHNYDLEWDNERGKCIGKVGSACVGTVDNPLPPSQKALSIKRIECVTNNGCIQVGPASVFERQACEPSPVHCVQVLGLPMGVGYCKEDLQQEITSTSTTTPTSVTTTTAPPGPEITTPSSASAKTLSVFAALTLVVSLVNFY